MIATSECFLWQTVFARLQSARKKLFSCRRSRPLLQVRQSRTGVSRAVPTRGCFRVHSPCFHLTRHVDALWCKLSRTHSSNHSKMEAERRSKDQESRTPRRRGYPLGRNRVGLQAGWQQRQASDGEERMPEPLIEEELVKLT